MSEELSLKEAKEFLSFDESLGEKVKPKTYTFQLTVDEETHKKIMRMAGSKWRRGRVVNQILFSVLMMPGGTGGGGSFRIMSQREIQEEKKTQAAQEKTKAVFRSVDFRSELADRLTEQKKRVERSEHVDSLKVYPPPSPPPTSES